MEQFFLQLYFLMQKMAFSVVDAEAFELLVSQGQVLEKDRWGVKVVETAENNIVKIFRLKRVYSSALIRPYAWRFKINAKKLLRKEIETVQVIKLEYCFDRQRHLVTYEKISGHSIKDLLKKNEFDRGLIKKTIEFIALIQGRGVDFRSLHFGNIIFTDTGKMALIDISDLKVYPWSLSNNQRIKNWKRLFKYSFETEMIDQYGFKQFINDYLRVVKLSPQKKAKLEQRMQQELSF